MPIYSDPSDWAIHCLVSPARKIINLISTIKSILTLSHIAFRLTFSLTAEMYINLAVSLSHVYRVGMHDISVNISETAEISKKMPTSVSGDVYTYITYIT